jgi:hypothetical protein
MDLLNKLYKKYAENKENSAPKAAITGTGVLTTKAESAAEAPVETRKGGNWLQRNRFVNYQKTDDSEEDDKKSSRDNNDKQEDHEAAVKRVADLKKA